MADEPRRSGRATKGQHKHASSSPAPAVKPTPKTVKSKRSKKSNEPEPEEDEDGDDEGEIRCICGNSNAKDKRAFIGCDACTVWQHNICMGVTDDEDDVPEHYFCEQCRPEEHQETVQALEKGDKIWETRNRIYNNEKKMSKTRKGKSTAPLGWLKKDVSALPANDQVAEAENDVEEQAQETGAKRKRSEVKEEPAPVVEEEKPTRNARADKRRKSSAPDQTSADAETAVVPIDKLPSDRQKIAAALSKIITDVADELRKIGPQLPPGKSSETVGHKNASLIEYELNMEHGGPSSPAYMAQFRALNANLKRNKVLVERILKGSLTANELATMESKDMASEELQKERAEMKEQLDRQAVAVPENDGPRYRRTHKGDELIEDENQHLKSVSAIASAQPVRERVSIAEGQDDETIDAAQPDAQQSASPSKDTSTPTTDAARPASGHERRQSSQNFDMSNIWAKTAGSPTTANAPRIAQPPRRQSSMNVVPQGQDAGTKHDADVDRMLQDDDEPASPLAGPDGDIVWRGKLIQSADGSQPTVNARWVAGRDMTSTIPWHTLFPDQLTIDGRLQINKAEEYLGSLQWSNSSDVTVLALTPYDDAEGFSAIFQYFKSRDRYAVVNKDKPQLVRDMYIIPVDAGAALPEHLDLLEHCSLKAPLDEKILLATVVVERDPAEPTLLSKEDAAPAVPSFNAPSGTNGQHLPAHVRSGGPAGSPVVHQSGVFSPHNNNGPTPPASYPGFPPNPYMSTPPQPQSAASVPSNPLVAEILGTLQFAPTAQQILAAEPGIDRNKLENLRRIMEQDPSTRTDMQALGAQLLR